MEENLEQILLTFVIPCYNVEKYIQRCLDSIYACDLPENLFEVVCINDCSPDDTQKILENNQRKYANLRIVVHLKNKGLGGARNTGIKEAKGKYLWFVDSDDSVIGSEIKSAVSEIERQKADVLCFNYRRVDDSGKILSNHIVFPKIDAQNGCSFVKKVFGASVVNHLGYVWRFLYRTDFLREKHLFFPENVCWEDTVYMPRAMVDAERVAAIPDVLYSYRVNAESISGVFGKAYPAKSIYDFSFCAGGGLLRFSEGVKDDVLRFSFRNTAIQKYINGFAIYLFRTSKQERKRFFGLIKEKEEEIRPLKQYMNFINRVMLFPLVGPLATVLMSKVYLMKHSSRE